MISEAKGEKTEFKEISSIAIYDGKSLKQKGKQGELGSLPLPFEVSMNFVFTFLVPVFFVCLLLIKNGSWAGLGLW